MKYVGQVFVIPVSTLDYQTQIPVLSYWLSVLSAMNRASHYIYKSVLLQYKINCPNTIIVIIILFY